MKKILIGFCALIVLCGCGYHPERCQPGEVYTENHYGQGYQCLETARAFKIAQQLCIDNMVKINKSFSDTWGNRDYDITAASKVSEKVYNDCIDRIKY